MILVSSILLSLFTSVEFYVSAVIAGAFIVAFMALPKHSGPAKTFLLPGNLSHTGLTGEPSAEITIEVEPDMTVKITRTGIEGIDDSSALSLAVTVAGRDITAEERAAPSRGPKGWPADTAEFRIEGLAPHELYHFKYTSASTDSFAASPLRIRPGIKIVKSLK